MSNLGNSQRPLRVAIVGAGPAGFFAAAALLKKKDIHVTVDLFEKLPAPFGLVRYGVAPDHPEIKRVGKGYEKTAEDPRFRYFGNVALGADISRDELREHYDQVLYTVGAQSDRSLGIPGEDLHGSYSATEFVAWYNGHPDYAHRTFDLSHEAAMVIGVGNVAMDAARILAKSPEELQTTDIADHALEALRHSKVTEVYVIGRRGPVQAKFTPPEIREFGALTVANPVVLASELELDPASAAALESDKVAQRNLESLREYAERDPNEKARRAFFRFCVSPVEILGTEGRVSGVRLARNVLEAGDGGAINARQTDELETIDCGLVLRSVGYRGVPLPGVPFDARQGIIPNEDGRVLGSAGEYVAGWIKRGPSGVIGTNKSCANHTVSAMFSDLATTTPARNPDPGAVNALLERRGVRYLTFEQWRRIDDHEVSLGEPQGRPRVKMVNVDAMLTVATST